MLNTFLLISLIVVICSTKQNILVGAIVNLTTSIKLIQKTNPCSKINFIDRYIYKEFYLNSDNKPRFGFFRIPVL
jgi:hypothetical protein